MSFEPPKDTGTLWCCCSAGVHSPWTVLCVIDYKLNPNEVVLIVGASGKSGGIINPATRRDINLCIWAQYLRIVGVQPRNNSLDH